MLYGSNSGFVSTAKVLYHREHRGTEDTEASEAARFRLYLSIPCAPCPSVPLWWAFDPFVTTSTDGRHRQTESNGY